MKLKGISLIESAEKEFSVIQKIRHQIHQNPETGFDVQMTAGLVAGHLNVCGFRVKKGVGRTGVVGDLIVDKNTVPESLRPCQTSIVFPNQSSLRVWYVIV